MKQPLKKTGMVSLVGRSNVGKSTLLNALLGFKMAPVSPKAQTTRFPVRGIYDDERGQIVFVDTPGLFLKSPDQLTKLVNRQIEQNINGIDVVLYVVDPSREIGQEEKRLLSMVQGIENKILVINKVDLPRPKYLYDYEHMGEEFKKTIHISAKTLKHLKTLLTETFALLPEGEPLYDANERMSDEFTFKQWVSEIIREKIFHHVHQEVPYSTHVEITKSEKRDDGLLEIHANILTDDDRYRPMIIGKKGAKIKEIGSAARRELELILQKKIFLKLEVETDPHWLERVQ